MSGQKYALSLDESDPLSTQPFMHGFDSEVCFGMFDVFTRYIKEKFESLSYSEPSQKQDVPVLCRGGRTSDTTQDVPLDQPPPYRLVEGSASRRDGERDLVENCVSKKDDERAVSPYIQITATPKNSRHWWRSLLGSRPKERHDSPQPTASLSDTPLYSPMLPKAQGPRRIYERIDRPRQESPIFKLPKPILMKIMMRLTPITLWSLRQASALFRTIFDDRQFHPFHDEVGLYDAHMKFSLGVMSEEERKEARAMLQPRQEVRDWCTACTQVRLRGEFEPAVIKLRELRFCDACGERHASIFFPQESIERGDENLACIGRLGKWELCSHMESIMWDSLKHILSVPNIEKYGGCPHPMHQPCSEEGSTKYSSFPRLLLRRWVPPTDSHTTIKIGWDLPLLDIDGRDPPSTGGIRSVLQQLFMGGALQNHKTCPHMADGKALSDFISAAVCDCFRKSGTSKTPDILGFSGTPCECSRPRAQYLICEDCGALYTWALTSGRITLIYRYSWSLFKPTSPAWLNLLDDLPTLAGIFHEKNKHIFWCDSPGCATGRDLRLWENMVKEEMGLHHERFENSDMLCDWNEHLERFERRLCPGIRLPRRVTGSELPNLLRAVREAAKSEFK